jgi:S1-C subfamily serine protease
MISSGTCFAVSADGILVTARHVVEGAQEIAVAFESGQPQHAKLLSASAATDLAVLKVESPPPEFLPISTSRSVQLGEAVFTIGFPVRQVLGTSPKFTEGSVSSSVGLEGEASQFQVSVPIQPGNSGGPLVTNEGWVVGVITSTAAVQPFLEVSGALPQNVNWAIKSDFLIPMVGAAVAPKSLSRGAAIKRAQRAVCLVEARK